MVGIENGHRHRRVAVACLNLILLSGCAIPKDAIRAEVDAAIASPEVHAQLVADLKVEFATNVDISPKATVGDQAAGEGGWNVGSINIGGGTGAILIVSIVVIAWLWLSKRKAGKLADILITDNESKNLSEAAKDKIRGDAGDAGVQQLLRKRLKKIRYFQNGGKSFWSGEGRTTKTGPK